MNIFGSGVTKVYLKLISVNALVRLLTAVVVGLSWLALVNHCELAAATAPKTTHTHTCCDQDNDADKPPVKHDHNDGVECCKAGLPAITSVGNNAVTPPGCLVPSPDAISLISFPDAPLSANILELDTGPPFASSFAEVVLQRSILAHAPPY